MGPKSLAMLTHISNLQKLSKGRFMDAYSRGLNGRQAAWAVRKYCGHWVLPASIFDELEKAPIV
jgi:hypothetical protein